ncbi:MAG: hypothetical protein E7443_04940 [Ruminococcaceae bacterium]|nr:hypothetical protein [Oscillospiraceae bacterium]
MPLFALKSLAQSAALEDAAGDYKRSTRAEQFRFSGEAVYFPAFPGTQYLPYAALSRVISRNTAISVKGTCGKQLPMVRVRMYYDGGEFYKDFLFEKQRAADKLLDAVRLYDSAIPVERDTTPFGT